MLIRNLFQPLPYIARVEFVFAFVLLFFECRWFVKKYLALSGSAMHAYRVCGFSCDFLYLFDHLGELCRPNTMFYHHIVDSLSVEILLGLLWINWMGPGFVVK